MPEFVKTYVRAVDRFNRMAGRAAMYLIFVMAAILLWSSFSKIALKPSLWTLEMAQFTMVAYYIIGGPYSMQTGDHVRMDLFYASWTQRTRAKVDTVTNLVLIFFLCVLLYGALSSTIYSLQVWERAHSVWRPYMWPIKLIAAFGIFLMLLQAVAEFFRDWARARDEDWVKPMGRVMLP